MARYRQPPSVGVLTQGELVCLACAHLMLGDVAAAEPLLRKGREGPHAVAAVVAWTATALLADAAGRAEVSAEALSHASAMAERNTIRRSFRTFDRRRLAAVAAVGARPVPVAGGAELLSEREREVLLYLPSLLTVKEIAGSLHISVNTVKVHIRSIYRKLGAVRRREAVVRARRRGLL